MTLPTNSTVFTGIHAVEELIRTRPQEVDRIYFSQELHAGALFELQKYCKRQKLHYQIVPSTRLTEICGSPRHQGVAALCSAKPFALMEELLDAAGRKPAVPLFLLAASVEDPHNLGAVIRSAVAFGVDGLILERKNTVALNATVAKTSAGMLEHMAIAKPTNLEKTVESLSGAGYAIVGAEGEGGSNPSQIDFRGPTLLIVGGEHRGIPPYLRKRCTAFVRIPTAATVPSLNLASAASILLYEIGRQRGFAFQHTSMAPQNPTQGTRVP
jgi:23S rRNA (guanosine2251-2'-O)-methyltransferase